MDIWILDTDFNSVSILDTFESFIWTDRYREYGDFEIFAFPTMQLLTDAQDEFYLYNRASEHTMIIEHHDITTDIEEGPRFIVTGRSLETILMRRIVWNQTTISGSLQNGVKKLITENIIDPEVADRKIPNFVFVDSTDPEITKLKHSQQYTGDIIYDVVADLCATYDIGFKVTLNLEQKQFEFMLYKGKDRSYAQEVNPYVVFSPNYENIINSDYSHSIKDYKNVTRIGGEGVGVDRKMTTYGKASGLSRREIFTDARDVASKTDDGTQLSDSEYLWLLQQRGRENLAEYQVKEGFNGEVEASKMFVYGRDFFLGDCVQVQNEFGLSGMSLVSEIVFSQDKDGENTYPTFLSLHDETPESFSGMFYVAGNFDPTYERTELSNKTTITYEEADIHIVSNAGSSFYGFIVFKEVPLEGINTICAHIIATGAYTSGATIAVVEDIDNWVPTSASKGTSAYLYDTTNKTNLEKDITLDVSSLNGIYDIAIGLSSQGGVWSNVRNLKFTSMFTT